MSGAMVLSDEVPIFLSSTGSGGGGSAPAAPTNLAVVVNTGENDLTWTASRSSHTPLPQHNQRRRDASCFGHCANQLMRIWLIKAATVYYYEVTAVNGSGESSKSSEVVAVPAPANIVLTSGVGQLTVSWDSVSGSSS